jgi:hypothetical protein
MREYSSGTVDAVSLGMTMKLLLALLLLSSIAIADRGPPAPDFLGTAPPRHIDSSLVASPINTPVEPLDVVAFRLDSHELSDAGVSQVASAARWLKANPRYRIVLEGHTDILGVNAYNEDLANRRINTVRTRLLKSGVHSDRIVMVTYGETEAKDPENPNDRRVVMFATKMSPRAVVDASLANRPALVATWSERNSLKRVQQGLTAAKQ